MFASARLAAAWFRDAWRERGKYHSLSDALRTATLRVSLTGMGKRFFGPKMVSIRLRSLSDPLWLRRGSFDIYALLEIFSWGEYAPAQSWDFPEHGLILDLGGNVGMASRYFAMLCPSARFIAVEPDLENDRLLRKNCEGLARNGRFAAVNAFVAAQDGHSKIDRSRGSLGFRMGDVNDLSTSDVIRCVSLPTLLAEQAVAQDAISLLKCDIEGAEADLFRDCGSWIGRVEHLIVETHAPYSAALLQRDLERNCWHWDSITVHEKIIHNQLNSSCFLKRSALK